MKTKHIIHYVHTVIFALFIQFNKLTDFFTPPPPTATLEDNGVQLIK